MAGNRMVDQRQGYSLALEAMNTGTYKGSGDILDWSIWDKAIIDGTTPTTEHRLFTNGLGSNDAAGNVKTLADTNVQGRQGGIPQGGKLYVKAIKVFFWFDDEASEAVYQSFLDMVETTTLDLRIYGKDSYGQWGLDELFGMPTKGIVLPAAAGDNNPPMSWGRYLGIMPLNLPIVLASNTTFYVEVRHWADPDAALDDHLLKVSLSGILERLA